MAKEDRRTADPRMRKGADNISKANRRSEDHRIKKVVEDVATMRGDVCELKKELRRNNETTDQIRDMLGTFRVTASIAKWVAAVGAAVVALWQGWDLYRK
jgi:hypothetical protein